MFEIGKLYTKRDIYQILGVPVEKQRGEWDKGYRVYEDNFFIFSNIGIPGRTGHDYNNYWDGEFFHWEATARSHANQPLMESLLDPGRLSQTFLFTRIGDRLPFTFEGVVCIESVELLRPVKVIWRLTTYPYNTLEVKNDDVNLCEQAFVEGKVSRILVNRYERNPLARRICIQTHGINCAVCDFNFRDFYGDMGDGYIQVHHLIPLASLGKEYNLQPNQDLVPVCPNCHAMLHMSTPAFSIAELRRKIAKAKTLKT
jgi:5-methylcytosine-specific restriction protein A